MSKSPTTTDIPAGYRQDAQGRLVHESQIKPIDQARDALVAELVAKGRAVQAKLADYKRQAFADIDAFVALSAEQYGVHLGGRKGNVTLLSFDGRYKVVRAIAEHIQFDERLQAAKALIDTCLRDWTEGARPEIVTLVQDAFRVDAAGNIRTGNVLALRRLDIADARWQRAMQAIGDAVQVVGSKSYVRLYERDDAGQYQPISLDIAGV
ncbi:hypothetical protein MBSD_n1595 [Mizugakiibacter sediminis]|uniref:Sulfate transporter n=1 Tax=Mizugakiibacter sediminis TaxID=1475481 RepID=A0A0K8QNL1_9GAMM|nr:DUF3164 family protein [Mizugakiibacter sediminis]GAP66291.1 hypothetical protein MBSD_n1595 [Mizugakiibacter sediminis]